MPERVVDPVSFCAWQSLSCRKFYVCNALWTVCYWVCTVGLLFSLHSVIWYLGHNSSSPRPDLPDSSLCAAPGPGDPFSELVWSSFCLGQNNSEIICCRKGRNKTNFISGVSASKAFQLVIRRVLIRAHILDKSSPEHGQLPVLGAGSRNPLLAYCAKFDSMLLVIGEKEKKIPHGSEAQPPKYLLPVLYLADLHITGM